LPPRDSTSRSTAALVLAIMAWGWSCFAGTAASTALPRPGGPPGRVIPSRDVALGYRIGQLMCQIVPAFACAATAFGLGHAARRRPGENHRCASAAQIIALTYMGLAIAIPAAIWVCKAAKIRF
jgi:hypothetical protein